MTLVRVKSRELSPFSVAPSANQQRKGRRRAHQTRHAKDEQDQRVADELRC